MIVVDQSEKDRVVKKEKRENGKRVSVLPSILMQVLKRRLGWLYWMHHMFHFENVC